MERFLASNPVGSMHNHSNLFESHSSGSVGVASAPRLSVRKFVVNPWIYVIFSRFFEFSRTKMLSAGS